MRDLIMRKRLSLTFFLIVLQSDVFATIDVNLNELEYLAARLNPFECRRLIAALHYTTYELPKSLAGAESRVNDDIPCFRQLVHWNSSPAEGKGKTHEAIVHRLRQINRSDLADWLGKSAFRQLGKDLGRAIARPFGELGKDEVEASYPITIDPVETPEKEDAWLQIDTILMAILLSLLGTLIILICASIVYRIKMSYGKSKYRKLQEDKDKDYYNKKGKKGEKAKYSNESTSEITDTVYTENETDTDFG